MEPEDPNKAKFDYKTLTIPKQQLWLLCRRIMKALKDDSCTDDEIQQVLVHCDAKTRGYIDPSEYITADKAMRLIHVPRNKFFELTHRYKVECRKINGKFLGYHIDDIKKIATKEEARLKKKSPLN